MYMYRERDIERKRVLDRIVLCLRGACSVMCAGHDKRARHRKQCSLAQGIIILPGNQSAINFVSDQFHMIIADHLGAEYFGSLCVDLAKEALGICVKCLSHIASLTRLSLLRVFSFSELGRVRALSTQDSTSTSKSVRFSGHVWVFWMFRFSSFLRLHSCFVFLLVFTFLFVN